MSVKNRPRRQSESLKQYADAIVEEFRKRTVGKSLSVDTAWDAIFEALCYEGRYVREVSPVAVVIYQRYFTVAVGFLKTYPDERKHQELVKRVKEDLGQNMTRFSKMKDNNFTLEERKEGSKAFGVIRKTLLSIA